MHVLKEQDCMTMSGPFKKTVFTQTIVLSGHYLLAGLVPKLIVLQESSAPALLEITDGLYFACGCHYCLGLFPNLFIIIFGKFSPHTLVEMF